MPRLTAQEIVDKTIANAAGQTEMVVKGIQRLKETPGAAAKKKKEKYRQNVLKALDDGTWDAGHDSYSLQGYQDITIKKVRDRWAQGIADSKEKMLVAREQLNQWQDMIEKEVAAMPNDTDAQTDARMLHNKKRMKQFKLKKTRR